MIWQNAWAWLGLITVALPVIIHLFGRGHARVHRFPSLRFLAASRLLPTRRTRLNDLLLLAVRASVLAVAAAALARPLLLTSRRSAAANAKLARVVIVDTSSPAPAIDSLVRDATASTNILTADVPAALAGAVAWLGAQPMRGEIAVVSRFPIGVLDSADVASVPRNTGLRFIRVPAPAPGPLELHARSGNGETITGAVVSPDRTDAEWNAATNGRSAPSIEILASAGERRAADAAQLAAASIPVALPVDSIASIAVVQPKYESRASLFSSTVAPRNAWMMDVVARVAADPSLVDAARLATAVAPRDSGTALVVARNDSGRPLVLAGERSNQLVFYSLADAGSLMSAALLAAITQATSHPSAPYALEPSTISDATLAAWQRAPSVVVRPHPGATDNEESDGRWLWALVLALLGVETWLRHERRTAAAAYEIAHDRAA
jgi:hypothetical protein